MFVIDKVGAQWSIDEGLRDKAEKLVESFPDLVGHVELNQVIFLRVMGGKGQWHGKCYYIGKSPLNIVPKFIVMKLRDMGLLNMDGVSSPDLDIFDIRYIIAINDDSISCAAGELERVEEVTLLHELMHIHENGDKLVKHDIEDFKKIIDVFGAHWAEGHFVEVEGVGEESVSIPKFTMPISGTNDEWGVEESD